MIIPSLPTDNYYKFLALSGISVALASVLYFGSKIDDVTKEIDKMKTDVSLDKLEAKYLEIDIKTVELKIKEISTTFYDSYSNYIDSTITSNFIFQSERIVKDRNLQDYYAFIFKYKDKLFPHLQKIESLKAENERLKKLTRDLERKILIGQLKNDVLGRRNKDLLILLLVLSIFGFVGIRMSHYGFKMWYSKVQRPCDEKLDFELKKFREISEV